MMCEIKPWARRMAGLIAGACCFAGATSFAAVNYTSEVKPLLAQHCYKCHGESQQKGDLRVDTAAAALKGGENGPGIKPGNSGESLFIQALKGTHDSISQMPYKKAPLSEAEIALIARWIDEGAKAPTSEEAASVKHWAFVAPQRPALPQNGSMHPVDAFIRSRLEKEGLRPAAEADRSTLLRRASLDVIGLPPTPAELDEFLSDTRADAFERAVERLLASPHYGERWGRWWLDSARYGDSNGYSIDAPRQIWKYRDWVIAALNRDLPFDQFSIDQLAGDLLPKPTIEQKVATGFNRNTQINQEGGIDPEQFRVEAVMDRVNTFGTVFLGLTVACAQCHDHKFDPVSQREYYQLYAFFNNTVEDGHGKGTPGGVLEFPNEVESAESVERDLAEVSADLERYLDTKGSEVTAWQKALTDEQRAKQKPALKNALKKPWDERSLERKRASYAAHKADDPEFKTRNARLSKLEKEKRKPITTLVMQELEKPRLSTVFVKGDFTRQGDKVSPGVPAILHQLSDKPDLNRLDLARWLFAPGNPLTARVIVNRVWQQYFGRGLVDTDNDFGTQGSLPTHPELLDWLACEIENPSVPAAGKPGASWSLKHLHRMIVTSATYRQSSRVRPELATVDPLNKLLARQSRLRLDAELVRDAALKASGLLSAKMGGPPVFPPQPDGVMTLGQVKREWKPSTGEDRYRRGVYTYFWRATPHPALAVFDAPDGFSACTRRLRSNTPLQALTLLNDQQYYELATALGSRLAKHPGTDADRLEQGFRLSLSRSPGKAENERLLALLAQQLEAEQGNATEAWKTVARVLLNLDEAITRE